jgi:5-methylthioadenosine/S-adenosylhomocysteine deaminase
MPAQSDTTNSDCISQIPDIIIEGGTLLTMVEGDVPLENTSIFIKKDRIIDIRPTGSYPRPSGVEIVNAEKCIIMPGLINGHCHTAMTIFRGYADDLPLKEWLFKKIFPAEAAYATPENVYWGSLLGCLEMIASGTTSFIEGYFNQDGTMAAARESGLRAIISQGIIDFPAPGIPDPGDNLNKGREFIEKYLHFSELLTPGVFCHSPVTCSVKTLIKAMEISMEHSLPMQIHLSETLEEVGDIIRRTGKRPAAFLNDIGILNSSLIAAHSIHLVDEEIDLLFMKGVRLVHTPESNMKLASGVARMSDIINRGIRPGIGTDGCASNNNLDLLKEMDCAAKLGKVFTNNPVNMSAATVLKMATSWGAEVMGLKNKIGTIEMGKKADIIVVDADQPHMTPLYNPVSTVVYSANGGDVKDTIVNGKILMKDRRFLTLDQKTILERVWAISEGIKSSMSG